MLREAIRNFLDDPKCPCEANSDQKEFYLQSEDRLLQLSVYKRKMHLSDDLEIVDTDMMISFFNECLAEAKKTKNSFFDSELRVYNYFNGTVGIQFGFIEKSYFFVLDRRVNDEEKQKKYASKIIQVIADSKEKGLTRSELTVSMNHIPVKERNFIIDLAVNSGEIATEKQRTTGRTRIVYMLKEYATPTIQ